MASEHRGRLLIQPLGTSRRLALFYSSKRQIGQRVAEFDRTGTATSSDTFGWLTILPSGFYVVELVSGGIQSVNQRKAKAAHLNAGKHDERD